MTTTAPDKYAALRNVLAAGPTPGPHVVSAHLATSDSYKAANAKALAGAKARAAFVAACHPATITSLLAAADRVKELEADARRLAEENDRWAFQANRLDDYVCAFDAACSYIDALVSHETGSACRAWTDFSKWRTHIKAGAAIDRATGAPT